MSGNQTPATREFSDEISAARVGRDLTELHRLVGEAVSRIGDMKATEQCMVFSEIKKLQGFLEHSDSRSWKQKGRITKKKVVLACKRALEELGAGYDEEKIDLTVFGKKRAARVKDNGKRKVSR
ncbi:MAG: hypothetical protein ABII71_04115 [Candidatus Micrarchaeota archaeon]